jgi:hypothetical protein
MVQSAPALLQGRGCAEPDIRLTVSLSQVSIAGAYLFSVFSGGIHAD